MSTHSPRGFSGPPPVPSAIRDALHAALGDDAVSRAATVHDLRERHAAALGDLGRLTQAKTAIEAAAAERRAAALAADPDTPLPSTDKDTAKAAAVLDSAKATAADLGRAVELAEDAAHAAVAAADRDAAVTALVAFAEGRADDWDKAMTEAGNALADARQTLTAAAYLSHFPDRLDPDRLPGLDHGQDIATARARVLTDLRHLLAVAERSGPDRRPAATATPRPSEQGFKTL